MYVVRNTSTKIVSTVAKSDYIHSALDILYLLENNTVEEVVNLSLLLSSHDFNEELEKPALTPAKTPTALSLFRYCQLRLKCFKIR